MSTISGIIPDEFARDRAQVGVVTHALRADALVVFVTGALMTLGAVMVYSALTTVDSPEFSLDGWWHTPLKQCVFALAGFLALLFAARLDYRIFGWSRAGEGWWAGALLALAIVLLALVHVPGIGTGKYGAERSITVLRAPVVVTFQPGEFAKLALLVWLAAFLTRPGANLHNLKRDYLPAIAAIGIVFALIGKEDFGTAALLGGVAGLVLVLAGAHWKHLIVTAAAGVGALVALVFAEPYRMARLQAFFSEARDPQGEGYQVMQSLLAIGSGGWLGRGLGAGVQNHGYLPQAHNDFIFAIVCEELGVLGGLGVIALFGLLLWRGRRIALHAADDFGKLLALGITLLITLQAAFNIAVVTDCVPTKGISLPFVSAGGSGVIFLGLMAGVLASIGGRRRRPTQT